MRRCVGMGYGAALLALLSAWGCQPSSPTPPAQDKATSNQAEPIEAVTEAATKAATAPEPAQRAQAPEDAPVAAVGALQRLSGEHFSVYDLLHNRPLAHRMERLAQAPALAVDAQAPDFVRYISGNYPNEWSLGVTLDGERASALRTGRKAKLWLPAWRRGQGQALQLRVHNPAKGVNVLKLTLNGQALEERRLTPGWQTVIIPAKADALAEENTLELEFSDMGRVNGNLSGGAVAWLRLGAQAAFEGQDAAQVKEAGMLDVPGAQRALALGKDQGAAWMLWALPKSKLSLEIEAKPGCGPSVEIFVQDGQGGTRSALRRELTLSAADGARAQAALDLAEVAGAQGQVARVELMAGSGCAQGLTLHAAQLVLPGAKPKRPEVPAPRYIVFWMIDTLRADYLPFYNPKTNVRTPALAKLAQEGAFFKVAFVQGNESKVSHASLFSGLYPVRHRVLEKGKLKPEHFIMPEAMKAAGYKTGAHISNGYISEPWGFVQGWDHFINNLRENWRIDGAAMAQHGIEWMKKTKDNPFFLYLGTIDPHVTYRAHEGIIETYDTEPYNGNFKKYLSGDDLGKIKGGGLKVSDRDKTRIINLYKNEITFNDEAFGKLRAAFEEAGLWDQTMVVVTADHGDEFWEHGSVGHGHNIHQELVHVPLLMYYKPLIKAGTVVEAGVDVLDVYPTLVDVAGKPRPKNLQGKSLVPLLLGQHGGYPEPATATRYLGHYTTQAQQWKLYLRHGDYSLYDRSADPLELKGVEAKHPLAARWLMDSLTTFRTHREKWDKTTFGVSTNLSGSFLEEIKKPTPNP